MDARERVAFTPDGLGNSLLHIYQTHNRQGNYFYQIKGDYQFTYEFASGDGRDDYLNILTMADDKSFYSQEPCLEHNRLFRSALLHYHDYYEFMIVLEGSVILQVEGKEYRYPEGSACMINRGIRHCEGFEGEAKLLFLGLSLEMAEELLRQGAVKEQGGSTFSGTGIGRFIAEDIREPGRSSYLDFIPAYGKADHPRQLSLMAGSLMRILLFPDFGAWYKVRGMICDLLSFLGNAGNYHCTVAELGASNDYLLFTRISHLMEERDGRVNRAELEKQLNYSGDYLNRIVKKYSGMPLFDFGMTFCLKKAEQYLETTDASVAEIAAKCGFTNKTHFYKCFRKLFGMTPLEYRRGRTDAEEGAPSGFASVPWD